VQLHRPLFAHGSRDSKHIGRWREESISEGHHGERPEARIVLDLDCQRGAEDSPAKLAGRCVISFG
jgi:hypothetical protein